MITRVTYGARKLEQCNVEAVREAGTQALERQCEDCKAVVMCFAPTLEAAKADAARNCTTVRIICHECVQLDTTMSRRLRDVAAGLAGSGVRAALVLEADAVKLSDVMLIPLSGLPGDA